MSMRSELDKLYALEAFERICAPYEVKAMRAAFDGNVEAAGALSVSLKNDVRGQMAVALWRAQVPKPAFREYLQSAWHHDHEQVVAAAKTRRTLASMFRYADFPLPTEMPERVTLWRGTSRLTPDEAVQGHCWTTNRDVASWFAMRFASRSESALVLVAEVDRADIALYHHGRSESEVVLMRAPAGAKIDEGRAEWQQGADRHARAHIAGATAP